MFGRSKDGRAVKRQSKSERKAERTHKGRGKCARKTIREIPSRTIQQPVTKKQTRPDAGPPLRTSGGPTKKQITGPTPEEVVRNVRGGRKR